MKKALYRDQQVIEQLDKRKGGYSYICLPGEVVNKFKDQRQTRLICEVDAAFRFQCGLNHLGNGDFFIILGKKILQSLKKSAGETISFALYYDPDPLGVPMPESLSVLLEQDAALKAAFEKLSMGKKRQVIHYLSRIKNLDKQISTALKVVYEVPQPRRSRK